jgi:hypothetical protein
VTRGNVGVKRLGLWQGTTPFWRAFILLCPLCAIVGAWYLASLRRLALVDIADNHFLQVGLAAIGVLMGPVGLITLRSRLRAYVIVSACPCCGVEAARDFGDLKRETPWPTPCGQCTAYLHAQRKSSRVREVRFDEPGIGLMHYRIIKQQYEGIVPRRDEEDRPFAFVMPTFCAVCSDPKAPFVHEIGFCGVATDSKGVFRGLLYPRNYPGKTAPTPPDDLDNANRHIQTPACAAHKDKIAMERDSGVLQFRSYRFYREFCALNNITDGEDAALKKAVAGLPQAVARDATRA